MKTNLRIATAEDIRQWYATIPFTMRAVIIETDGEAVALGGMMRRNGVHVAFMDMRESASSIPFSLWKGSLKAVKEIISTSKSPVYARVSDELKTAPSFLKRLGFVPIENNEKVMIWQIRSQQE
ncbi:hypothetical protein ACWWJF_00405 [Symbiopectobacterium sp. Eva_TO]